MCISGALAPRDLILVNVTGKYPLGNGVRVESLSGAYGSGYRLDTSDSLKATSNTNSFPGLNSSVYPKPISRAPVVMFEI